MAQQYYLKIFADIMETDPANPALMPDPYDNNVDMETNIKFFYRSIRNSIRMNDRIQGLVDAYYLGYLFEERLSTPASRRQYRNTLSKHYLDASIRVYSIFKIVGHQQIYRTKRSSFWMFRKLSRADFIQLTREALFLF